MEPFNAQVFDEIIEGTSMIWLTSAEHNDALGRHAELAVQAVITNVSGSSPTLRVFLDSSNDNQNWFTPVVPTVNTSISEGLVAGGSHTVMGSFQRLRIVLGGTSPRCRLKLGVTGRL
jgi:hypothetical protein